METPGGGNDAPTRTSHVSRWTPVGAGVIALLPFLVFWRRFSEFFFFGDDWDQLDQIDRQGLWHWIWGTFAENFVPFWKAVWVGTVLFSGGSHTAVLAAMWITHAIAAAIYAALLLRNGIAPLAALLAAMLFALPASNIETLTWTTQWNTVLAATFLLAGMLWVTTEARGWRASLWTQAVAVFLISACSAWSMARGVMTGPVLAALTLWPRREDPYRWKPRMLVAALAVIPSVLTAGIVATHSSGNHQAIAGHFREMVEFGWYYYALNPLHRLLELDAFGWRTTALLGVLKSAIVVWVLLRSTGRTRGLLVTLALINLGEAMLLGVVRYHTGLEAAMSSRYQYLALIEFAPFPAILLQQIVDRARRRVPIVAGVALASAIPIAAGWFLIRAWTAELDHWAHWRGRVAREIVLERTPPDDATEIPGIDGLRAARARELAKRFHLH